MNPPPPQCLKYAPIIKIRTHGVPWTRSCLARTASVSVTFEQPINILYLDGLVKNCPMPGGANKHRGTLHGPYSIAISTPIPRFRVPLYWNGIKVGSQIVRCMPGLSLREKHRVRNANRNERSRGRSLLHGQDIGKTQDHRKSIEQLQMVGGWRLAVGGSRRLVAVGSGQPLAVGGS